MSASNQKNSDLLHTLGVLVENQPVGLSRVAGLMTVKNKPYRIRRHSASS
ncbi:MAG: hypothetical protein HGB17_06730 [Syntrophobacteraceae bacterium]|nr:hypothetical protein [Syntrophobacteraceae bacterium]